MKCLLKNIPPHAFGVPGNRGRGFPLTDNGGVIAQPEDASCYLVKEEDAFADILAEGESQILVTCSDPVILTNLFAGSSRNQ
jgi:hypothetical protein